MSVVLYPPPANAPRLRTVTPDQVLSWRPCWVADADAADQLDALLALAPAKATARDALRICRDGGVSAEDTLWLLLRPEWWECPDVVLRVLACDCASAALAPESDPRSLGAVRVAWRFAQGEAGRTELVAAAEAARDAWVAWGAAWDEARATRAAWGAALVGAWDAAWSAHANSAAGDAVRPAQVQRIADLLALPDGA